MINLSWLLGRRSEPDAPVEPECDYFALDETAGRAFAAYARAVTDGAPRQELARVLTGLAGCELAMSYTSHAAGFCGPDGDGRVVSDECRLSGLLLLEVAHAADEGITHRGVRFPEFRDEPVATAIRGVAFAYGSDIETGPGSVGQAIVDLIAVLPVESLSTLARAHRGDDG